jgi:hypothetical protein
VPASEQIDERRVWFAPGATSAVVVGRIQVDRIVDHLVSARAGQAANAGMAASTGVASFGLIAPSETGMVFQVGARAGNPFEGVLPESGDGGVRVSLVGDRAPTTYRLEIIVADVDAPGDEADRLQGGPDFWEVRGVSSTLNIRDGASAGARVVARVSAGAVLSNRGCVTAEGRRWCEVAGPDGDLRGWAAGDCLVEAAAPDAAAPTPSGDEGTASRAGRGDFDATGQIPCAQARGQPMGRCDFAVARGPGGEATVVVTRFDGTRRALFFQGGEFVSADTSQADGYPEYRVTKEADLFMIRVGDERYEIPDAVVFGG